MDTYEKKYKEALERARAKYAMKDQPIHQDLVDIFPELAEPEDEMISKEITEFFKNYSENGTWKAISDVTKWIAWLEKQAWQKPADKVEPKFKVKYAGSEYNVLEVIDIAGVTFYGIEDEPNHIDYVLPNNCEIVSKQTTAWSDDDENNLDFVVRQLRIIVDDLHFAPVTDWLESLKRRVQPKQEWSHNDNMILETIEHEIERIPAEGFIDSAKDRCLEWLRHRVKYLNPRNAWKPSEEQMEIIDMVLSNEAMDDNVARVLRELKEELKKL